MSADLITVESGTLAALAASEIDRQIATAKKYPRNILASQKRVRELATLSDAVAETCMYSLPRKDRDGKPKPVEGASIRFAEILAAHWGNCRVGARIVAESDTHVTAQGVFHDLETNTAITLEIQRRITDKNGRRYNADMIGVTSNAAAAIALREAILKGIPRAFWIDAYEAARSKVAGDAKALAVTRDKAIKAFAKWAITEAQICTVLGVPSIDQIGADHIVTLKGLYNSIRDGEITPEAAFSDSPRSGVAASVDSAVMADPSTPLGARDTWPRYAEGTGWIDSAGEVCNIDRHAWDKAANQPRVDANGRFISLDREPGTDDAA